jgi:hypothetical protein
MLFMWLCCFDVVEVTQVPGSDATMPRSSGKLSLYVGLVFGVVITLTIQNLVLSGPMAAARRSPGTYDAIIVAAGGQTNDGPPPHVMQRILKAAELYKAAASPKPKVITTAWGTPHKPCPHDEAGFEVHESADNAKVRANPRSKRAHAHGNSRST